MAGRGGRAKTSPSSVTPTVCASAPSPTDTRSLMGDLVGYSQPVAPDARLTDCTPIGARRPTYAVEPTATTRPDGKKSRCCVPRIWRRAPVLRSAQTISSVETKEVLDGLPPTGAEVGPASVSTQRWTPELRS